MQVSDFSFELPEHLIAHSPANPRDMARLLVGTTPLQNAVMRDLPEFLAPGDILVCNDTKVIPARLKGKRGTASAEVTLHQQQSSDSWLAFAKPARKLNPGDIFTMAEDFSAEVLARTAGEVTLKFNQSGAGLMEALLRYGTVPLPPYIRREAGALEEDKENYQTIYARVPGAVAAPTAGLHFTDRLLQSLEDKGIKRCFVTLHVGAGTFLPVTAEDTKDHIMHSEYAVVPEETVAAIRAAKAAGGRVVCVGTTALRAIESACQETGELVPWSGDTRLFITPGYRFRAAEVLLTNFHLPRSTLFMLVSAFAGMEKMKQLYAHAIAEQYRFYSYGDASVLFCNKE